MNAPTYSFTELAFNLCSRGELPGRQVQPRHPGQDRSPGDRLFSIDRERNNEIANQGTSFVAHGLLPSFYKDFYEVPEQDYPYDPELANQLLDEAGWTLNDDGIREKDGEVTSFDLYVRSEAPADIQQAKLIAEQTQEIGVEFNVQIVSTDKLTELTIRKVDGEPAPEFDSFIWGWGGDPYDPSFLLSLMTTDEIGASSDAFYSNPEYDRLFKEQTTLFVPRGAQGRDPGDDRDAPGGRPVRRAHRGSLPGGLQLRLPRRDRRGPAPRRPGPPSASRSPTSRC